METDELYEVKARIDALTNTDSRENTEQWLQFDSAVILSICILLFGTYVIHVIRKLIGAGIEPDAVIRSVVTASIVTLTMFLVVVGYSESQLSAALGLFGTIVGFMLGKADRR